LAREGEVELATVRRSRKRAWGAAALHHCRSFRGDVGSRRRSRTGNGETKPEASLGAAALHHCRSFRGDVGSRRRSRTGNGETKPEASLRSGGPSSLPILPRRRWLAKAQSNWQNDALRIPARVTVSVPSHL